MPEQYWPKRKNAYSLGDAAKNARHLQLRCNYCKRIRYMVIADLKALLGNIEVDDVAYVGWRCDGCKGTTFDVRIEEPHAGSGAIVKRLVRIDYVRRPTWQEEKI